MTAWKQHIPSLIVFLLVVVAGGAFIGTQTAPGPWFDALQKPFFNPPAFVFAPVWTFLYILIAIAGWRSFHDTPRGRQWWLWLAQMALNFAWSPIFFSAHRIGIALVVILALLAVILAFIATAWNRDRLSAWLFAPYALWVAFASLLNASLLILNG